MITNFFLGIIIGLANLVPGVSGGTIAVVSGKYDLILESFSKLLSFKFEKKYLKIILPLILGTIFSILLFAKLISFAYEKYPNILISLFVGLIFGGLFLLLKEVDIKSPKNIGTFSISFILVSFILFYSFSNINIENPSFIYLLFAGIISISTMVLPGISGSSMLLIMGIYKKVIDAIPNFDLKILLPLGIGIIIGLILIVKILNFLLKKYRERVISFLIALTLAGCIKIMPSSGIIFVGFILGFGMEKLFKK